MGSCFSLHPDADFEEMENMEVLRDPVQGSDEVQKLSERLARVSHNANKTDIIIFGAGIGGIAMLEVLHSYKGVNITAIVDISEEAPAFALARELGIKTSTDGDALFATFNEGILIDVTGDSALCNKLDAFTAPPQLELISAKLYHYSGLAGCSAGRCSAV